MKTIAVIPLTGSPFHEGHWDVGRKVALSFDTVIFALGYNPEKSDVTQKDLEERVRVAKEEFLKIDKMANDQYRVTNVDRVKFDYFSGFLVDYVEKIGATAVFRGIRGVDDIGHEMVQQFWNEDLGMTIPTYLVMADRGTQHISSSVIKQVDKINNYSETQRNPQLRTPLFKHITHTWTN